jgi:threonine dehydrogenase-like Zn-dependent dehydrogenase
MKDVSVGGASRKVWRRGGHAKMLKPPKLFGHEAAGKIVALGAGVRNWQIGDRNDHRLEIGKKLEDFVGCVKCNATQHRDPCWVTLKLHPTYF